MKIYIVIVIVLIAIVGLILSRRTKSVDKSFATYKGNVANYDGKKKLIVVFTASWASAWKLTEQELKKLDFTKFDLCILDQSVDKDEIRKYGIDFLPTVALFEKGKIVKKVQNLSNIEQIKDW
jgi:thioredoxin-like negative regulator of GroEL